MNNARGIMYIHGVLRFELNTGRRVAVFPYLAFQAQTSNSTMDTRI